MKNSDYQIEYTITEILFSSNNIFKIELSWCQHDPNIMVDFLHQINNKLKDAKIIILDQVLYLSETKYEWLIKIDRDSLN